MNREWSVASGVVVTENALRISFSRSSGPGGQNVNKVATRVEVTLDINAIEGLDAARIERLRNTLRGRISARGLLRVAVDESRSQSRNRELAVHRLIELVRRALRPAKRRVRTSPTKASKLRRLEQKKRRSLAKVRRKGGMEDRN